MFFVGSPPQVISFQTKSLFNLCADFNEIYLAASSEVNQLIEFSLNTIE